MDSAAEGGLVVRHDVDDVRWLTLNRPGKANALSVGMVEALHAELDRTIADQRIVLVLQGNYRHFCAGFDLADLNAESDATLAHRFLRLGLLLERFATLPFATVAVVSGVAVGAGADLAAACDHRLGTPSATFRFPGPGFGVALGVHRLSQLVGPSRAMRLLGSGGSIGAESALAAGLLTICTEPAQLDQIVLSIAAEMTRVPAYAIPGLLQATRPSSTDSSLATLTRSLVSQPGLTERIKVHAAWSRAGTPNRNVSAWPSDEGNHL